MLCNYIVEEGHQVLMRNVLQTGKARQSPRRIFKLESQGKKDLAGCM